MAVNHYNFLLEQARSSHFSTIMAENERKLMSMWNSFQKILRKSSGVILPDNTNLVDLVNMFGCFFGEKNFKIRSGFKLLSPMPVIRPSPIKNTLFSFMPVSKDNVLKIFFHSLKL